VLCCVVEQELYELLEAVNRAGSLKAVYESAMDFIRSALKCDKVAILLFDEAGVMRFVASRELSEKYRSGVEGHSPWRVGAEHAEPIWIPDTELEGLEAHIAESVKAERIRALGFIPLQVGGFVIGKFMVYFGAPHEFTARERRLTEGIAIQLALAIQRWQMAEELRRGKEQYRIMIEQVKDYAIFSTDTAGRPIVWNEGVQRILGFSETEFVGREVTPIIFTPEDFAAGIPQKEFDNAARTGSASNNRWMRRKDGTRFWAEGVTTALRDEGARLIGFSKVFKDSTASWQSAEDLKASQRELTALKDRLAADLSAMTRLQNLAALAVRPGVDFRSLLGEVLDAAIAITAADKGNVQMLDPVTGGLRIAAHRGFGPAFLEFFEHVCEQAASCGAAMRSRERILIEDITKSRVFQGTPSLQMLLNENVRAVQSTPLVDRTGKVLGMISTHFGRFHRPSENELRFLDILARQAADWLERSHADQAVRHAKEQLATANQELDRKVQERTSSLNATLQSLETLLYSIAHDLRAPNRAMQGYAHLLIESHANGLNDKAKFFLHRIAEAALKNEAMIRDLLEYGRLAHAELHCAPLDPALNIHAVLQGFELEIAEKGARVKVSGQWPKVSANDSALTHVLANLVSNALKYVPPGVRPQIEIFPASVNGSTHESNGWVRLCIRDNGIGVPAEQKESIFDLFQRASNASAQGTGMGLAIVRKAAERMGGQAGVDSTLGKGSTFWVALKKASS